jgi:hypothetical protein
MKILSFDGDVATVQLKALEIRTLRNAVRVALQGAGDPEERLGAPREVVEGLLDTLSAVFDQVDPGDI